MITIVQLKGTHPISGKESESKFCDRFWCFIHTNPHSVFTFRAGMKSKIPSKASKTKGNGNKVDVLENIRSKVSKTEEKGNQIDLLELKTKYEDLSNENVELKTEIRKSEEKTKRMMDDLKLMCQQIEASRVDQEKKLESTDEKIKKLEKENHDLKQHNWHLKMVKLPHYVKLLHQKDEEIAELESKNQVGYLKDRAENLLKEKDKPEEITLDEDDDDDICEIDIEPVSKPSLPQVVNLDLEADNGEDKSDILLIGQKKEETSDGTTFKLEERKLSEKTQLTGIIDAMMQTPDAGSTIKKEEVSGSSTDDTEMLINDTENLINDFMLNLSQKVKAKKVSTKVEARKVDYTPQNYTKSDGNNHEIEKESDGGEERESDGGKEKESDGGKSAKRKRKLFNSFCDDLMDENGEVHHQVKKLSLIIFAARPNPLYSQPGEKIEKSSRSPD